MVRLNSYGVSRNFSKSMNAAKILQFIDGDLRLDKIANSVIKESEVFFSMSCFYVLHILFRFQQLLSLLPKYVRCLVARGCVLGCFQP